MADYVSISSSGVGLPSDPSPLPFVGPFAVVGLVLVPTAAPAGVAGRFVLALKLADGFVPVAVPRFLFTNRLWKKFCRTSCCCVPISPDRLIGDVEFPPAVEPVGALPDIPGKTAASGFAAAVLEDLPSPAPLSLRLVLDDPVGRVVGRALGAAAGSDTLSISVNARSTLGRLNEDCPIGPTTPAGPVAAAPCNDPVAGPEGCDARNVSRGSACRESFDSVSQCFAKKVCSGVGSTNSGSGGGYDTTRQNSAWP